jgi:GNAT superfamily N-acetyltransferase
MAEAYTVTPATPQRWDDVATVMATRGDPSRCWCQYFKLRGKAWETTRVGERRKALRRQVEAEPVPPGVLAYAGQQPVGWCAVAPKPAYPRLLASRLAGTATGSGTSTDTGPDIGPDAGPDTGSGSGSGDSTWAVTCFVVVTAWRRRGVASALLGGAVDLARSHGAAAVEGYPVDPAVRESVSASALYRGTVSLFAGAGFVEVERPRPDRAVVRLDVVS